MNGAREDAHAAGHSAARGVPGGLAISAAGYTLQGSSKTFEAGREEAFGLRILDRGGRAVREFDEQHGERMHLMVVRRDLVRAPRPARTRGLPRLRILLGGRGAADAGGGPARSGRNGVGVATRSDE